jgi:hypothetical protein
MEKKCEKCPCKTCHVETGTCKCELVNKNGCQNYTRRGCK